MSDLIRRRLLVSGLVQGVFFRESTRRAAEAAGASGWVRNLPDGQVEVAIEGTAEAVAEVVAFCRTGPAGAEVSAVQVHEEPPEGEKTFQVRLTPPRP